MVEIHDNSDAQIIGGALFGFIGWSPQQRQQNPDHLRQEIEAQLARCFGPEALNFTQLHVEDWQDNPHVCAQTDRDGPAEHAQVLPDSIRETLWDGKLQFICAETAQESAGLIDGALESGLRGATQIGT